MDCFVALLLAMTEIPASCLANIPCNFPNPGVGRGFMTGKTVLPGWLTSQESLP
jgi:hypothetical protein